MTIGAYAGTLGSGKTLDMVIDAWSWSLAAGGAPIAANFTLNPASFAQHFAASPRFRLVRLRNLDDIVRFIVEGGGILLWDEMHVDSDARQSTQARNILLSQWLMFLRKWGITCLYTVQDPSQVDRRMRNVTDFLTFCEGWGKRGARTHRFTRTHYRSGRVLSVLTMTPDQLRPYYGAYDTFEYTERLAFPNALTAYDAFMRRCGEGATFSRGYEGDPDRAWEAFVSQTGHPAGKAPKGGSDVSQPGHVRKSPGRAKSPRRGSGAGDSGSLAQEA